MTDTAAPDFSIRAAAAADMPAVQAIYAHHVAHGAGTFDLESPHVADMEKRRAEIVGDGLPYVVATEADGTILGFAYASPFRNRPGYRFSIEDSIYVAPGAQRRGVGRHLLAAVIAACTDLGIRQMLALIGGSENAGSIGLHAALGFTRMGVMQSVGYKNGTWLDVVIMQRTLGDGDTTHPAA